MSLDDSNRALLVKMQMEKARLDMQTAAVLVRDNYTSAAAGRIYFAVFHAVSALLIHAGIRVKSHKGAYTMFCLQYVNTGKMPQKYGKWYRDLEVLREESDYNCFYDVTVDDLLRYTDQAQEMIDTIARMVEEKGEKR